MASANLTTRAIVLRRTDYGEADRILTVLTPNDGQLSVMAKGVRREKSKLAGGIELFSICELSMVRRVGTDDGLWTLTSSRIIEFFDQIIADYDRLQFGYRAIKVMNKYSQAIDTPELYSGLSQVFQMLNSPRLDLRLIECWFNLLVARLSGGELNLTTDKNGMKLVEGVGYGFDINDRVFVFTDGEGRFATDVIKLLRLLSVSGVEVVGRLVGVDELTLVRALELSRIAAESI